HGEVQVAVEENLQLGPITDLRGVIIEGKADDRVVLLVEMPRKRCVALIVRELESGDTIAVGGSLHVAGNAGVRERDRRNHRVNGCGHWLRGQYELGALIES